MVSSEERLLIGLKVLERLRPGLRARRAQLSNLQMPDADEAGEGDWEADSGESWDPAGEHPAVEGFSMPGQFNLPTLQEMLSQAGELPPCSLLLGACEDGLPFLLDLNNPDPGSLLIAGDAGSGKTRLLRAVLASAVLLNPPSEVAFNIIADRPSEYAELEMAESCEGVFAAGDPATGDFIIALSYLVEERRRNGSFGPAMVLAIDDLAALLQSLSQCANYRAIARLLWIIQYGPGQRVWVMAALASEQAGVLDERLLSSFHTHLLGSIASPDLAGAFYGEDQTVAAALLPGCQFCVPFGGEWVRFWICSAD